MDNQKLVTLKKQQVYLEDNFVELERKRKTKKIWRIVAIAIIISGFVFELFVDRYNRGFPTTMSLLVSIPFWVMGFWKARHLKDEHQKTKKRIQDTKIAIIDAET